jgi:protein tyrosine phosphatase (PTP) superfamily phosphohydrolase (DUF442 family)
VHVASVLILMINSQACARVKVEILMEQIIASLTRTGPEPKCSLFSNLRLKEADPDSILLYNENHPATQGLTSMLQWDSASSLHKNMRRWAVTAIIFTACLASISLSQDLSKTKITNFGQINPNYYRGAQPKEADFAQLSRLGVKTVVDLRQKGKPEEPTWARNAGMQYFNIPLSSRLPATLAQTVYFLTLVNNPGNWPVFVHCAGGKHRTGEMTAIYRIAYDFWNADRAYEEMKKYGFYSFLGHGSLKRYVYDYYRNFLPKLRATQQKP